MLYAVSVFTYFVASLASVLVGHDESEQSKEAAHTTRRPKVTLTDDEAQVVRRILSRIESDEA